MSVETKSLVANPHNPRMLFDKEPMATLEASIRKVGILVPLTVFMEKGSSKYTILDGQRRWICAIKLGLESVPINQVAEPSIAQNIVTMFQIHKLRKDWELMPTALKLEVLMHEMNETRDKPLAELTGLNVAVVGRCKKLLSYPKRYREMMLFPDPKDRIKADFFIELHPVLTDRVLGIRSQSKRDQVTEIMLDKYLKLKSGFKSLTDFRKIKSYIAIAKGAGKEIEIRTKFWQLLESDDMNISDLEIDTARVHREAKSLVKSAENLSTVLSDIRILDFLGEEEFWKALEKLVTIAQRKIRDADRRFTSAD